MGQECSNVRAARRSEEMLMSTEIVALETLALSATALSIGGIHTLLGPDHYVPFAAMSHAGGWSAGKTLRVTVACGLGHVAGSVALGLVGLAIGVAVLKLEFVEAIRGDVAGWMLVVFGAAYLGWGFVGAASHHGHAHSRRDAEAAAATSGVWTPWLLFIVFAFGPCEPLIPLLIYPASQADGFAVAAVVVAFAVATVGTMVAVVLAMRYGAAVARVPRLKQLSHALAGLAILACGLLVTLGL
jgi:nickel/cobalt exporter